MKTRIYFVLLAVVLAAARVSPAKTLFGQNYTALYYSYFDYGDGDKSYLDDGNGGSVLVYSVLSGRYGAYFFRE